MHIDTERVDLNATISALGEYLSVLHFETQKYIHTVRGAPRRQSEFHVRLTHHDSVTKAQTQVLELASDQPGTLAQAFESGTLLSEVARTDVWGCPRDLPRPKECGTRVNVSIATLCDAELLEGPIRKQRGHFRVTLLFKGVPLPHDVFMKRGDLVDTVTDIFEVEGVVGEDQSIVDVRMPIFQASGLDAAALQSPAMVWTRTTRTIAVSARVTVVAMPPDPHRFLLSHEVAIEFRACFKTAVEAANATAGSVAACLELTGNAVGKEGPIQEMVHGAAGHPKSPEASEAILMERFARACTCCTYETYPPTPM